MSTFRFYDVVGVLIPGALALLLAVIIQPAWRATLFANNPSLGDISLFVVLAYVAGQLLQSVASAGERFYWALWGGLPTDWVRTSQHRLLGAGQIEALQLQVSSLLASSAEKQIQEMTRLEWSIATREMYAAVVSRARVTRVDTFNGIYGLNRGLTCVFFLGAIFVAIHNVTEQSTWGTCLAAVLLLVASSFCLLRMHRFALRYAQELFAQFLQAPVAGASTGESGLRDPKRDASAASPFVEGAAVE